MKRFAALVVLVAGAAAACGSSGSSTSSSTPAPGTAAGTGGTASSAASTPAASGKPVEISVLDHQDIRIAALAKLIPKFEADMAAQGKNIKVKLVKEVLPDDQFQTKLTLQYSQGKAPDVTSFVASSVPDAAAAGYLLDLSSRVAAWPDWKAHFYPVVQKLSTMADGKIYTLPRGATLLQLFYRKDVLDKLGISTAQPATWPELIDRMRQVTAKTGKPSINYPAGTQWGGGSFDEGFMHVMLGTASPMLENGKWVVKSPGLTKAFEFYAALAKAGLLPVKGLETPEPWNPIKSVAFVKGELPVTTSGSWAWKYDWGPAGGAPIPNLEQVVSTWLFPTSDGSPPFATANLDWSWAISAKSSHPDEAWEFVKWMNSGEGLATDLSAAGSLSPRDDLRDVAPYKDSGPLVRSEPELAGAKVFQPTVGIAKIQQAVGEATEAIIQGKADGAQAAAKFADTATQLLGSDAVTESSS
jgi:multiple sugar transport system substrate-binding protein